MLVSCFGQMFDYSLFYPILLVLSRSAGCTLPLAILDQMKHFACLADGLFAFRGFQDLKGFWGALGVDVREDGLDPRYRAAILGHLRDSAEDGLLRGVDGWVGKGIQRVELGGGSRLFDLGFTGIMFKVFSEGFTALFNRRERSWILESAGLGLLIWPTALVHGHAVPFDGLTGFLVLLRQGFREVMRDGFGKVSPDSW